MNWDLFRPSKAALVCWFLLAFSLLLLSFRLTRVVSNFRQFLFYWVAPQAEIPFTLMQESVGLGRRLASLAFAHYENQILKEKIGAAIFWEHSVAALEKENQRLRNLLNFDLRNGFIKIPVRVIGWDPDNLFQTVLIDRGMDDGVQPDWAVIALGGDPLHSRVQLSGGLCGRVLECAGDSSKVLLISDPLSSVSVTIERNGESAVLQGVGAYQVMLEYVNQTADVTVGDIVLTSGLGGIFPAGIFVGEVTEVLGTTGGFKRAKVKTGVSLSAVREMMILKTVENKS